MTTLSEQASQKWWAIVGPATELLSALLIDRLPRIGGKDYWSKYVEPHLKDPGGKRNIQGKDIKELDLAILLKIALSCRTELATYLGITSRDLLKMLIDCKDARNMNAHSNANGVSYDNQIKNVGCFYLLGNILHFTLRSDSTIKKSFDKIDRIYKEIKDLENLNEKNPIKTSPIAKVTQSYVKPSPIIKDTQHLNAAFAKDRIPKKSEVDTRPLNTAKKEPLVIMDEHLRRCKWLIDPSANNSEVKKIIKNKTYMGIDFGTSTTVISIITQDEKDRIMPIGLAIEQLDEDGSPTSSHIVNSVLAWNDKQDQLLFGEPAYRLRQELHEGKNVFTSFKMQLGINLGPVYTRTKLNQQAQKGYVVETPVDATREFFKMLIKEAKKAIVDRGLPREIAVAVSVPASFEANQRLDLLTCIGEAGISIHEGCFMDEPNAAFLSFINDTARTNPNSEILTLLKDRPLKIMVYDFGAGTCDVSILEVSTKENIFTSKNRSISRFMALGGDDIDRAIARKILLPQLLNESSESGFESFEPDHEEVEDKIIPKLQLVAESLKIAAVKWMSARKIDTLEALRLAQEEFKESSIPRFAISRPGAKHTLTLLKPRMTTEDFADALELFTGTFKKQQSSQHFFSPAADAIDKSGLRPEDIDIVLFIGGSCENPIVRSSVLKNLPSKIIPVIPPDLRKHVSYGTALHSLGFNGFNFNLIKPITPEPIFIVTKGGALETILPASSEVPSEEPFKTKLLVQKNGQKTIELPICVSNENKILYIVKIESSQGFRENEEVLIECRLTKDKLLDVRAKVGEMKVENIVLNPMSNQPLSPNEAEWLEEKVRLNTFKLDNLKKHPPKELLVAYAEAAFKAEKYEIAGDAFVAAERVDPDEDQATNICVAYSHANRDKLADEYAKIAHDRNPNEVTAYNLAIRRSSNKTSLLEQSLKFNPEYPPTLLALGKSLTGTKREQYGRQLMEKCKDLLARELKTHKITKSRCRTLIDASNMLGDPGTKLSAQARLDSLINASGNHDLYHEDNLTISSSKTPLSERN